MMMMPELPAYTRENMRLCSPISTYGNSIAFFHQDYNSHCLDIGVIKQYGIVSSWAKALSLTMTCQGGFLSRDYIPRAVGFTRSGKIVLEMGGGQLVSQDLETKETKDLGIIGYKYNFVDAYVESHFARQSCQWCGYLLTKIALMFSCHSLTNSVVDASCLSLVSGRLLLLYASWYLQMRVLDVSTTSIGLGCFPQG